MKITAKQIYDAYKAAAWKQDYPDAKVPHTDDCAWAYNTPWSFVYGKERKLYQDMARRLNRKLR